MRLSHASLYEENSYKERSLGYVRNNQHSFSHNPRSLLCWIRPLLILSSLLTALIAVSNVVVVPVSDTAYGHIATNQEQVAEERLIGMDTETAVRSYFSDIPVMIQIAKCESTFQHTLPDGTILRGRVDSADTGVMQINLRYHAEKARKLGLNLENMYDNMVYARNLYERLGTKPWASSASCWSHTIAMR